MTISMLTLYTVTVTLVSSFLAVFESFAMGSIIERYPMLNLKLIGKHRIFVWLSVLLGSTIIAYSVFGNILIGEIANLILIQVYWLVVLVGVNLILLIRNAIKGKTP